MIRHVGASFVVWSPHRHSSTRSKLCHLTEGIVPTQTSTRISLRLACNDNHDNDTESNKLDDFFDNLDNLLEQKQVGNDNFHLGNNTSNDGWRRIDWKSQFAHFQKQQQQQQQQQSSPPSQSSPVEPILVRNRVVYVKRDDQINAKQHSTNNNNNNNGGAPISGNKARKFKALNDFAPATDFPSCVVSYGGPQSNAMVALAAVVHFQNQKATTELMAQQIGTTTTTSTPTSSKHDLENIDEKDKDDDDDNDDENNSQDAQPQPPRLKRFVYYTKKLPRFLRNQPNGNLFRAQALGMELVELSAEEYGTLFGGEWGGPTEPPASLAPPVPGDSLWVPQGGACGVALQGVWELANEIVTFWSRHGHKRPLTVCIPGGTCSTAALVHCAMQQILRPTGQGTNGSDNDNKHRRIKNGKDKDKHHGHPKDILDIRVVVVPCVGDELYAQRQMTSLLTSVSPTGERYDHNIKSLQNTDIPTILSPIPPESKRYHYFGQKNHGKSEYYRFGEPHIEILSTFRKMKDKYNLVLDLLYGAPSWSILLRHFRTEQSPDEATGSTPTFDPRAPLAGREIMYVHSGGLEGINSQLMRYKYKGLVDIEEVQLPGRR